MTIWHIANLQITATSGAAADNTDGMTIHGALGLTVKGGQKRLSAKLKRLWMKKSMLIIDEISMVSYNMLVEVENQCRVLKDNKDFKLYSFVVIFINFHLLRDELYGNILTIIQNWTPCEKVNGYGIVFSCGIIR